MISVINLDSFQGRFVNGLLFSMIEGLVPGEEMQLISDGNFQELVNEVSNSGIPNLSFGNLVRSSGKWQITIRKQGLQKAAGSTGCCGGCGGG